MKSNPINFRSSRGRANRRTEFIPFVVLAVARNGINSVLRSAKLSRGVMQR
jgi:hypothetical protein